MLIMDIILPSWSFVHVTEKLNVVERSEKRLAQVEVDFIMEVMTAMRALGSLA